MQNKIVVAIGAVATYADNTHLPPFAAAALERITHPQTADEKRAGYGLLEQVCRRHGLSAAFDRFTQTAGGKPLSSDFDFSITHAGGLVAVAIGGQPLGLDMETTDATDRSERLMTRIALLSEAGIDPLLLWTRKEAAFKRAGDGHFAPAAIDTTAHSFVSRRLTVADTEVLITLCAEHLDDVIWETI